jgi:hypothetical protein
VTQDRNLGYQSLKGFPFILSSFLLKAFEDKTHLRVDGSLANTGRSTKTDIFEGLLPREGQEINVETLGNSQE